MFEAMSQINYIAVLAATVATTVVGGLWFTVLFGRAYASALGREFDPKAKPSPIFIVGPFICSLVTVLTSALLMKTLQLTSVVDGAKFGAVVGVGYLVATMTNTAINPNMPHPLRYAAVSGPFFLLTSVITGILLAVI